MSVQKFLRVAASILLLTFASLSQAQILSFERYHSQTEINTYLREVAQKFPALAKFYILGQSQQNREISFVILSNYDPQTLPALYFNGTHHGNEKSSTESVLALIDFLIANRSKPEIATLLDNYAIYLQPMVNPDGHAANTRSDSRGKDPNRDYSFPLRSDENSFKLKEIGLVKKLLDTVKFRAATAYHSGMEGVLWPWCYSPQPTADHEVFSELSRRTATAMAIDLFSQSNFDYPTDGEFIDYAYMNHQTLALTVEVSTAGNPRPSELDGIVKRTLKGALAFMTYVNQIDQGNNLAQVKSVN